VKPHPTETAEYWLRLARTERAFASEDRGRRTASVESIRIHEQNAAEYEARAAALAKAASQS
jgi:hypothetical protein